MITTAEFPANSKGHEQKTPTRVPTDTPVNRERRSFLMALAGLAAGTALSGCGEQKADTRVVDREDTRFRFYNELASMGNRLEAEEEDLRDLLKKYPAGESVLRIVVRHDGAVQEYNDAIKRYEFDKGEVAFENLRPGKALLPLKPVGERTGDSTLLKLRSDLDQGDRRQLELPDLLGDLEKEDK